MGPFGLPLFHTGNTMGTDKDEYRNISIIQAIKATLKISWSTYISQKNHIMRLLESLETYSYNINPGRVTTNQVYSRQWTPHLTASDGI